MEPGAWSPSVSNAGRPAPLLAWVLHSIGRVRRDARVGWGANNSVAVEDHAPGETRRLGDRRWWL